MSMENCMCEMCPNTTCKHDPTGEVVRLSNRIADLESALERANGIQDTLKHTLDYILENA